MTSKRVLVIGAGVIGATTAYELLEKGYEVTILAKKFAQGDFTVTSEVAGAQWEYPPGFCGRHNTEIDMRNPKRWAMVAYDKFKALGKNSNETGVFWRPLYVLFQQKMEETAEQLQRLKDMSNIPTFHHSASYIKEIGISPTDLVPVVDAFTMQAPAIDTIAFMKWIYHECRAKGAKFVQGEIRGKLKEQIEDLKRKYNVDLVINCTGLAARELAEDDKVCPLRGIVLKIKNDGVLMPKMNFSIVLNYDMSLNPEDESDGSSLNVYIIPRGNHSIWIGASVEERKLDITGIDMTHELPRKILDNAKALFLPLRSFKYEDVEQVIVGLRPARKVEVRNEIDPECPALIHNYGHAGGGFYLSWGSALDAAILADKALAKNKMQQKNTMQKLHSQL